ncbi:MAG TPA: MBL fold metallo-hydrolase [Candidatus Cybelea sp.]|jgi:glyoxylase-like metal-dependent hydrolase (beta-lactamase superfamily II)|nr:MBL fold metallo-hydrolase [Candidatus Cybelea sp.]
MVTVVRAPNASPMTLQGTNSYIIECGEGAALVIDPGPAIDAHIGAIVDAAAERGSTIRAILLTHGHPDHAMGAPSLVAATGARLYAHPNCKTPHDEDLPLEGDLRTGTVALRVIDAPGHTFDHAIFYLPEERALFTGDTILGEGTTVIAPPGGAMRPYQRTLQRLAGDFGDARVIYGGHGPVITDPSATIADYIEHREMREQQILDALREKPQTIPDLVRRIYTPQRQVLWPAMARQILAHLIALENEGRVVVQPLSRAMTAEETAMLNPRIEEIVGPEEAAVIVAELGTELRLESLNLYSL